MIFDCSVRTHVGHKRKLNEDSLLSRPDCGLWAVADGMGGHDSGEIASAMIVEALGGVARAEAFDALVAKAVAALEAVNDSLIAMARSLEQERSMGSTVVALVAAEGQYRCLWVGDSRAYRVRAGSIEQLTVDHSLVQELVKAGMLEADQAENHPNGNVLTRAVGASAHLEVDGVGGALRAGDIFVLASDGLTRLVTSGEMLRELVSHPPEVACDRMLETTLARGAPDNVSFIVIAVR